MSVITFPVRDTRATHEISRRMSSGNGDVGIKVYRPSDNYIKLNDRLIELASGVQTNAYVRKDRASLLLRNEPRLVPVQAKILGWLRDNINPNIPSIYYHAVLGHDLHVGTYAELYMRHYHATERDPCDTHSYSLPGLPTRVGRYGWLEDCGLVGTKKVTVVFRNFEVDALQGLATPYADYKTIKFHRPGTTNTAESNADTTLAADTGLEATGTQTEGATSDIYKSVATVTADSTETWVEHQIRSQTGATGGTLLDRTVLSSSAAVINLDTVEFTYQLTKNAEA